MIGWRTPANARAGGRAGSSASRLPAEEVEQALEQSLGELAHPGLDRRERRLEAAGAIADDIEVDDPVVRLQHERSRPASFGQGDTGRDRGVPAEVDLLGRAEVANPQVAGGAGAVRREERRLGEADIDRRALHLVVRRQRVPDPDAGGVAPGRFGRERGEPQKGARSSRPGRAA